MKIGNSKKSGKIDFLYLNKNKIKNIDEKSNNLCFSIPVHEKQDVINNQIENILNFNPGAKIILHVNKSFKDFKRSETCYDNVYINRKQYNYVFGKGLLWIHIQNFCEIIELDVDFKYFVILSSNEMFIRFGCAQYIEKWKNGLQCVGFDKLIDWHNFHKGIENDKEMIELIEDLRLDRFYGGQTEGQFYEKDIFNKIKDIYLKHFGDRELMNFESEEIILQTIFKGLSNKIDWGLPITLQNYSNSIKFTEEFITNILYDPNFIIPDKKIEHNLLSIHAGNTTESIFTIKRVDRTFNEIRALLTLNGFIMTNNEYFIDRSYYSHGCELKLLKKEHILFKKSSNSKKHQSFQWFGYNLKEGGFYKCFFEMKVNRRMDFVENEEWGIKIECSGVLYNFFTKDLDERCLGKWRKVEFPFQLKENSMILFYFDNYLNEVDIEFKNIVISNEIQMNHKDDNIALVLYNGYDKKNVETDIINYNNVYNNIVKPLNTLFDIYTFIILEDRLNIDLINKYINNYLPNGINYLDSNYKKNNKLNNIFIKCIDEVIIYKIFCNMNFKFVIMFDIDSLFTKNITDFNFYINKLNFISYRIPYINHKISNSVEFISFPYRYIDDIYNLLKNNIDNNTICYQLYWKLKDIIGGNNFNFIFNENFAINGSTPLIKYKESIGEIIMKDGFLFNWDYIQYITYYNKNKLAMLIKEGDYNYHFIKKKTIKDEPFIWIGIWLDLNELNFSEIRVKFSIKIIKNFSENNIETWGIKTHSPVLYYKDWINTCIPGEYTDIELNIKINKNSQYIIFCFDNYRDDLDFYIRNFKIIIDY